MSHALSINTTFLILHGSLFPHSLKIKKGQTFKKGLSLKNNIHDIKTRRDRRSGYLQQKDPQLSDTASRRLWHFSNPENSTLHKTLSSSKYAFPLPVLYTQFFSIT
jgi:hypothetical protein